MPPENGQSLNKIMGKQSCEAGQVLPYFVTSILALCLFWFALVNLGKIVYERTRIQIAADNAALTAANMKSRGFNLLGALNGFLGMPGFMLPLPGAGLTVGGKSWVWWIEPPHRALGLHTYSSTASAAKSAIAMLVAIQKTILPTYGGGTAFLVSRKVARINGAEDIIPLDNFSFHLKRNKGDIYYFKTSELFIPATPITPEIWIYPIPYPIDKENNADRWLEMKKDEFHKQRMRLIVAKKGKSSEKYGYPFAGRFFAVGRWPDMKYLSAAASYNVKGAMFPVEGNDGVIIALTEYLKARNGGWESHLVPAGSGFRH